MKTDEISQWIERNENLRKWFTNWFNANLGEGGKYRFIRENRQRLEEKIHEIRYGE